MERGQHIRTLRVRFTECRRTGAPLATWRELQLEILTVARTLHIRVRHDGAAPRSAVWEKMGDAFWFERDLSRLAHLIDQVIAELENHEAPPSGGPASI